MLQVYKFQYRSQGYKFQSKPLLLLWTQVLDEIGIGDLASMGAAPGKKVATKAAAQQEEEGPEMDEELMGRLANLKS